MQSWRVTTNLLTSKQNCFVVTLRLFFDELHACQLEQDKEKLSTSSLLLDTKIQQIKIISHSMMFQFISTMRSFDHDAMDESKR